jgi:DNA recombination protein RmuC
VESLSGGAGEALLEDMPALDDGTEEAGDD